MNTYEFWNEMGIIFDAIVAYQEKTIEFNKRFINPWVKLGNVFDKNESNEDIVAHKNAIEIDPENAQNWYELASTYTRFGNFEKSIQAYQKAIDLGFESGELYKNLALAYAMTAKHQDAVPVFQKALDLLENDKDKAVVCNHLGNVYRKLDNYEMALQAFQQADQFEIGKAPTVDELPAVAADEEITEELTEEASASQPTASPLQGEEPATVMDSVPALEETTLDEEDGTALNDSELEEPVTDQSEEEPDSALAKSAANEVEPPAAKEDNTDEEDEFDDDMPVVLEVDFSAGMITEETDEETPEEEPVAEIMAALEEDDIEAAEEEPEAEEAAPDEKTFAEIMAASEEDEMPASVEDGQEGSETEEAAPEEEPVAEFLATLEEDDLEAAEEEPEAEEAASDEEPFVEEIMAASEEDEMPASVEAGQEGSETEEAVPEEEPATEFLTTLEEDDLEAAEEEPEAEEAAPDEEPFVEIMATLEEDVDASEIDEEVETLQESDVTLHLSAYEEYLEDNDPVSVDLNEIQPEETQTIALAPAKVEVTNSEVNMEVNTDLTVEIDTKNAHVWNELGNVYFNAGSYDDAIIAYSKAIELDKQFAWSYTNLALSYVQKERLADAILLYQRGIELFSDEKDKAVAWNRLGNVYRRMNDYENAIAAYQRADELDPGNTTITEQSRFSMLGSEKVNQEIGYSI